MQILPPDFDPTEKYPVLFHPYGGPNSQEVTTSFFLGIDFFVASQNVIVVKVDGRGNKLY